jgi:hypothetical protein
MTQLKPIVLPKLIWLPSPNFSSRHGTRIDLLVYHETAGFYNGDISWLRNPKSKASALGVLREDGMEFTQLVKIADKSWTQAFYNPRSVGVEHSNVTSKGYSTEIQLKVSARIFGWLALKLDIPVRIARGGNGRGICRHSDLGSLGGGHTQCGMSDINFERWLKMIHHEVERGGYKKVWAK